MSLFEIIGEWVSPGPTGGVRGIPPRPPRPSTPSVLLRLGVSTVGITLLLVFVGIPHGSTGVIVCLVYVGLGTILQPQPDMSNVGLLGGLVDHPFRISDDINRLLLFLLLAFLPARIIGSGFVMLLRWLFTSASRAA